MSTLFLTDAKGTRSTAGPQGVAILTGNPKKANLSLSGPMIIGKRIYRMYDTGK